MVRIKTNVEDLKKVFKCMLEVTDECNLEIKEDNTIELLGYDPGYISACQIQILNAEILDAEKIKVCIDVKRLYNVMSFIKEENVILDIDKENTKLQGVNIEYKLSSHEPKDWKMIETDLTESVSVYGEKLRKVLNVAGMVSDYVLFTIEEKGLILRAKEELHGQELEYIFDDTEIIEKNITDIGVSSLYSVDYLGIVKHAKSVLQIKLGKDKPIALRFNLSEDGGVVVNFLLAPRIESD